MELLSRHQPQWPRSPFFLIPRGPACLGLAGLPAVPRHGLLAQPGFREPHEWCSESTGLHWFFSGVCLLVPKLGMAHEQLPWSQQLLSQQAPLDRFNILIPDPRGYCIMGVPNGSRKKWAVGGWHCSYMANRALVINVVKAEATQAGFPSCLCLPFWVKAAPTGTSQGAVSLR